MRRQRKKIYQKNKESHKYIIIKSDTKTLTTLIGEVRFKKRLYRNQEGYGFYMFVRLMR